MSGSTNDSLKKVDKKKLINFWGRDEGGKGGRIQFYTQYEFLYLTNRDGEKLGEGFITFSPFISTIERKIEKWMDNFNSALYLMNSAL